MTDLLLSLSEQDFIRTGCATNCRGDGRAATEFRHSTITTPGPIPMSHGSARLTSADGLQTMLCSVKAELVTPSQHQPRHGSIVVSVDQHGVTNRSQMRESQVALQQRLQWVDDLTTLCVVPGAAVWRLHVDLLVIISSAITSVWSLDAASHCIRQALANTVLPAIEIADEAIQDTTIGSNNSSSSSKSILDRLMVNSDIALAQPAVMLESVPFLITVHILTVPSTTHSGGSRWQLSSSSAGSAWCWILDATPEEQAVAVAAVHVAVRMPSSPEKSIQQPIVTAVWKSGGGSVPLHLLPTVVQTAVDAVESAQQSYRVINAAAVENRPQDAASSSRQWLEGPLLIQ